MILPQHPPPMSLSNRVELTNVFASSCSNIKNTMMGKKIIIALLSLVGDIIILHPEAESYTFYTEYVVWADHNHMLFENYK